VQKVEGRKKKTFKKSGNNLTRLGVDLRPATSGRLPVAGRRLALSGYPFFFLIKKK
jgi:hypothetical protein